MTNALTARIFRQADSENVRQLYFQAMAGHDSPRTYAMNVLLFHPLSYVSYILFATGIALIAQSNMLGAPLSTGVAILFFGHRYKLNKGFVDYCEGSLRDDLADIPSYYKLQQHPLNPDELVPSGPSGFWVVETTRPNNNASEIVGCVALDCTTKDGILHGELRRMVASPYHRRRGIASLLIEALVAHARKSHIPAISLMTTRFQPQAMQLYRKFGWVEQYKIWMREGFVGIWVHKFHLDLTDGKGTNL